MAVEVNGSPAHLPPSSTVTDVVDRWCSSPEGIAVARNRQVVPRSQWASEVLADGDRVEIVTAAAGG